MKVLAVITARGGSKGIPGKNIKKLGSKPLIAYVIEDALRCSDLDRVIVSTDSTEIAEIAEQYGAEVPFMRPTELATDSATSIDVVKHALLALDKEYDAVCLLQPTSPFKPRGFISKCINHFEHTNADSLVSVLKVPHEYNPHWTFKMGEDGELSISTGEEKLIPRRQELPATYHRDGSVYVISRNLILQENKFIGGKTVGILSDPRYYANLDTMQDWQRAQELLNELI